jgi:hypothetical protein
MYDSNTVSNTLFLGWKAKGFFFVIGINAIEGLSVVHTSSQMSHNVPRGAG